MLYKVYTKSTTAQDVFGQYQVSSAVLGRLGDGNCYLMHKMAGLFHAVDRNISKIASICAAVF